MTNCSAIVARRDQRGATLVVLLITLLVMTLVGVSLLRSTTVDERMAGNYRDRDRAFQGAEQALSECLAKVKAGSYAAAQLAPAVPPAAPVWEVASNWSSNAYALTGADSGLASAPLCLVEKFDGDHYRITARGIGAQSTT